MWAVTERKRNVAEEASNLRTISGPRMNAENDKQIVS